MHQKARAKSGAVKAFLTMNSLDNGFDGGGEQTSFAPTGTY